MFFQFIQRRIASQGQFRCNCSGSHQGTKTQRIDMSLTPLSEKEERISRKTLGVAANAFGIHKTQGIKKIIL